MIRLVQLQNDAERCVALVDEPRLERLTFSRMYDLVNAALAGGVPLQALIKTARTGVYLEYDPIYAGQSDWRILPPLDHLHASNCYVSGTGLTHLGSAKNRDAMHEKSAAQSEEHLTDSMKMFRWGVQGGKPAAGQIGIAPEWFYKGSGDVLRAHNQPLEVPAFAEDGGEEAEIAGVYIIDPQGHPVRIGMAQGNEFSDHVFEKKNYLNLAGSKLRTCAIGPELVIHADFQRVPGQVSIFRGGETFWTQAIATGESEMCHSLANIEHHHFKFDAHRRPGDVHVHFFGAFGLSFGQGVRLKDGDIMQVQFENFGRPLRNPLHVIAGPQSLVTVAPLQ